MFTQSSPRLDLLLYVSRAVECGRTVLTVPWVVEYLSMVDLLAPQLHSVSQLLQLLLRLYR